MQVTVCSLCTAFVHSPWLFGVLRFLSGVGGVGTFIVAVVVAIENTTPDNIVMMSQFVQVSFS